VSALGNLLKTLEIFASDEIPPTKGQPAELNLNSLAGCVVLVDHSGDDGLSRRGGIHDGQSPCPRCRMRGCAVSVQICVLSREEAGRLENWGIWFNCAGHRHISKTKALEAVQADTHRVVGGKGTKVDYCTAVVPVAERSGWVPVQCHDYNGRPVMGLRTWGNRPVL
jgi:hypothetical protein